MNEPTIRDRIAAMAPDYDTALDLAAEYAGHTRDHHTGRVKAERERDAALAALAVALSRATPTEPT